MSKIPVKSYRSLFSQYLSLLASEIRKNNVEKEWDVLKPDEWDDNFKIPATLANIHSELSEAMDEFAYDNIDNFYEELGDVFQRLMDLIVGLPYDKDKFTSPIDKFVQKLFEKMEINRNRPIRHGGKRI